MIRMLAGVYGLYKDGKVTGIGPDDGPFELTPEREAELVAQGNAEYVVDAAPIGFDEQPPEKPIEEMTAKELREIGKEMGYTFKIGMTKAEMIECIKHGPPDAEADDGDDAPTFDATEAVE